MSHYVKKYFKAEKNAKKLFVFLHGYNGCVQDIDNSIKFLSDNLPEVLIVAPEAETPCEKNVQKRQWYSLWEHDSADERRKPETSLEQLTDIYNRYGESLHVRADEINLLIDELQKNSGIGNKDTIIGGFSQGAMLACYTALTRCAFDGMLLMFSGVVAGAQKLALEQKSYPETFLFHGKDDVSVNYKTMDFSLDWLQKHQLTCTAYRYDNLAHKMREDELSAVVEIIRSRW